MARARNIKPGILKNEVLGTADEKYTILFLGLWMLADREGRLEDRPLRIKAEVFPLRDGVDVGEMLNWLDAHGFITRYEVDGQKCIWITKFREHQRPHHNEPQSALPCAPLDDQGKKRRRTKVASASNLGDKDFALIPDPLIPDSPSLNADPGLLEKDGPPFASEGFGSAWARWVQHRREKGVKLTPTSIRQQFRRLAEMGEARAIRAIDHSIANNYQGIYEPTTNGSLSRGSHPKRADSLRYDPAVHGELTPIERPGGPGEPGPTGEGS